MKQSNFQKYIGGEGRIKKPGSPEIVFLKALIAGDTAGVLACFAEEKQFGGLSAVDCPHGRYEGLNGIREFAETFYHRLNAVRGEVEIATQTLSGCRAALEFVVHLYDADGNEKPVAMALAADLRDGMRRLDEVRTYMHPFNIDGYPVYRKPIFPPAKTPELRHELLSGIMPVYMKLVHEQGMTHIPDLMTRSEDIIVGAYSTDDNVRLAKTDDYAKSMAEEGEKPGSTLAMPLRKFVMLRMETIIDDGKICCVEWEQLITRWGREVRGRLSEPGISFYERAEDGLLKSFRIIDYANTESRIDWSQSPITKEEAEKLNYFPE